MRAPSTKKRSVAVTVTSRANFARVKSALIAIQKHPFLDLRLFLAASAIDSQFGSIVPDIEDAGLNITSKVRLKLDRKKLAAMATTTGEALSKFARLLVKWQPDVVLVLADRYETVAAALASVYLNIPLAHILGGEISGSIDEKVRHAITKFADLHFVANETARERLMRMGEEQAAVHVTGCPSLDLALKIQERPGLEQAHSNFVGGGRPYLLVIQHPVTTEFEESFVQARETLAAICALKLPTLWFLPNVDPGSDQILRAVNGFPKPEKKTFLRIVKNLPPDDFLHLVNLAACIVGNSSIGFRECSFLGIPAVNIGSRQAGRDRGKNVVDVDHDRAQIIKAIQWQLSIGRYPQDFLYGDGHAGERIANLLATVELRSEKRFAC